MQSVRVPLKEKTYNILIGHGLISRSGEIIKRLSVGRNALIITNRVLLRLYGSKLKSSLEKAGISCRTLLVPDSEKAKSDKIFISVLNRIGSYDSNKAPFLIALGGGVTGDLTGFAASVYKRGIPYIQIPTTLLSQVDSAIGGKTAIDLPAAKNLAGSFYQPKAVISDTSVLKSLSARQVRSGLAECIKYGVIKDASLFEFLERNRKKALALDREVLERIVSRCSRIKASVVASDEFDKKGRRIILNYGHTIGHAIESACGYSRAYNHGEAIAIGMVCASRISSALGIIDESDASRIESLIKGCSLPVKIKGLKPERIYRSLLRDKKFVDGKSRLVLPVKIGGVRVIKGVKRSTIMNAIRSVLCTS
jgi:3-dehydroquinate synthase